MRKVTRTLASMLLLSIFSVSLLTSCGGKKEEAAEVTDSTEQAAEHPDGGEHQGGGEHPTKDSTGK